MDRRRKDKMSCSPNRRKKKTSPERQHEQLPANTGYGNMLQSNMLNESMHPNEPTVLTTQDINSYILNCVSNSNVSDRNSPTSSVVSSCDEPTSLSNSTDRILKNYSNKSRKGIYLPGSSSIDLAEFPRISKTKPVPSSSPIYSNTVSARDLTCPRNVDGSTNASNSTDRLPSYYSNKGRKGVNYAHSSSIDHGNKRKNSVSKPVVSSSLPIYSDTLNTGVLPCIRTCIDEPMSSSNSTDRLLDSYTSRGRKGIYHSHSSSTDRGKNHGKSVAKPALLSSPIYCNVHSIEDSATSTRQKSSPHYESVDQTSVFCRICNRRITQPAGASSSDGSQDSRRSSPRTSIDSCEGAAAPKTWTYCHRPRPEVPASCPRYALSAREETPDEEQQPVYETISEVKTEFYAMLKHKPTPMMRCSTTQYATPYMESVPTTVSQVIRTRPSASSRAYTRSSTKKQSHYENVQDTVIPKPTAKSPMVPSYTCKVGQPLLAESTSQKNQNSMPKIVRPPLASGRKSPIYYNILPRQTPPLPMKTKLPAKNLLPYNVTPARPMGPTTAEIKVEELTRRIEEQMNTQDLAVGGNYFGICFACDHRVNGVDQACQAMGNLYHVKCFVCCACSRYLRGKAFYNVGGKVYCEEDYMYVGFQQTAEKCSSCGHLIMEEVVQAMGKSFHPACFRCCVCNVCLDGIPFTVDIANKIYCVADYCRKFAPKCATCKKEIIPVEGTHETVRVVSMDKDFHVDCYVCEDCGMKLTDELDKQCYPLNSHLLCRSCHILHLNGNLTNNRSELESVSAIYEYLN